VIFPEKVIPQKFDNYHLVYDLKEKYLTPAGGRAKQIILENGVIS
jgi:hypothetical protein